MEFMDFRIFKYESMRKAIIISILVSIPFISGFAQDKKDDFQSYREKMLTGYMGFRKSIMDDYAKFLNGVWDRYKAFKGDKAYPLPKPKVQPEKKKDEPTPKPKEVVPEEVKPSEPISGDKPNKPKPVTPNPSDLVMFEWCGMGMQLPDAKIQGDLRGLDKESVLAFFDVLNIKHIAELLKCSVCLMCENLLCKYLSKLNTFLIEAVYIP